MYNNVQQYSDFMCSLALEHGAISVRYFYEGFATEYKHDASPVTQADIETEKSLSMAIHAQYPQHNIIGEESVYEQTDNPYTWVIDPIDGTKSFIAGIPLYTMLLALLYEGEPLTSCIYAPVSQELVYAIRGKGAFYTRGSRAVRSCRTRTMSDELPHVFLCTDPKKDNLYFPQLMHILCEQCAYMRSWGDGYGYLMLASGRADSMFTSRMALWDVAPIGLIIEEAGGIFCDGYGHRMLLPESGLALANEYLYEQLQLNVWT